MKGKKCQGHVNDREILMSAASSLLGVCMFHLIQNRCVPRKPYFNLGNIKSSLCLSN
jgi:hypothetical protein